MPRSHLMGISYFVASQENACRYCYGMARAIMKIAGFKEKQIQDLENEASLADGLTRQVVEFARKLARSNPSPARRDQEALVAAGLSEEAACEIAANVVKACFANRISTFLALPPDEALERLPDSLFGRIRGLFLGRKFAARRVPPPAGFRNEGPCARIIEAAGRNPIAAWLRELTDGWFDSPLLPRRSRLLILAVIARQLGSQLCEQEATDGLAREGFAADDTQALLATLSAGLDDRPGSHAAALDPGDRLVRAASHPGQHPPPPGRGGRAARPGSPRQRGGLQHPGPAGPGAAVSPVPALLGLLAAGLLGCGVLGAVVLRLRSERRVLGRRLEQSARELDRLQRSFARFAPAELVERIATEDAQLAGGERREVTVLFADLRDFTQLSERLDPAAVLDMLNGYFLAMTAAIQSHHGHVTRLMGDGIMSVFGALERNPWHVQDAVEAALAMRESLARYNESLRQRGLPELAFGVGIHCGAVIAGLVGSRSMQEFTVLGDVVNVASRVEALTRRLGGDILVTDDVRSVLGDRFLMTAMPPADIKGKSRPVLTWAVQSLALAAMAAEREASVH